MHDYVDTKRARYPLLTANVQQQLYLASHAAPKVVTFGLLTAETRVQSQGIDKSSYSCTVSEYHDMSCDYPVGYTWTEKYGGIDRVHFETFRSDIPKIWDFFISFQIQMATHGPQTNTKLVGSVEPL